MCVTKPGKLYASEKFWNTAAYARYYLGAYLLKIHKIFEFSLTSLPQLTHINVNLEILSWEILKSKVSIIYNRVNGVLIVVSSDDIHWPSPLQ